jgi:hypothetical protein
LGVAEEAGPLGVAFPIVLVLVDACVCGVGVGFAVAACVVADLAETVLVVLGFVVVVAADDLTWITGGLVKLAIPGK